MTQAFSHNFFYHRGPGSIPAYSVWDSW